ncbi:MAG: hypothetical protein Q8L14_27040 [Myxococcales bacterium]|nr:hypothetical protein [Myxococcales bacterium]
MTSTRLLWLLILPGLAACNGGTPLDASGPLAIDIEGSQQADFTRLTLSGAAENCPATVADGTVNGFALRQRELGGERPTLTNYVNPSTFCATSIFEVDPDRVPLEVAESTAHTPPGTPLRIEFDRPGFIVESAGAFPAPPTLQQNRVRAGTTFVVALAPAFRQGVSTFEFRPAPGQPLSSSREVAETQEPEADGTWRLNTPVAPGDYTLVVVSVARIPIERCEGFATCSLKSRAVEHLDVTVLP